MSEPTRKPHRVRVGDTLTPFGVLMEQSCNPIDLEGKTVKFYALAETTDTEVVAETDLHVTAHPTSVFTVDVATNRLRCRGHKVQEGNQVVVSNSDGALPGNLSAGTAYFAVGVQKNSFQLATYESGQPITLTAGTGTHSFYVVGHGQYDWQTEDVASERKIRAWFTVYDGDERQTFPPDKEGYPVWIS